MSIVYSQTKGLEECILKSNLGDARIYNKIHIDSRFINFLLTLKNFEIVIVCDDSFSMTTEVDGTHRTRWDELREIVKRILQIAVLFDQNGVDIYFLNEDEVFEKIKNPKDVDDLFSKEPNGYTPLVPILSKIFQSRLAKRGREKKLLVFVATDGKPTNVDGDSEIEELEDLLRNMRTVDTTYVSFLLCTDERECVDYMERWDRTMINVDVTDDYETEKEKIRRCQGDPHYPFTYDDYIVKALIGSIVPHIDRLNEPRNPN